MPFADAIALYDALNPYLEPNESFRKETTPSLLFLGLLMCLHGFHFPGQTVLGLD